MPFTMYTWPNVDLALVGAGLVMKALANQGALALPPLPGAEAPTYINALPMRTVMRTVIDETGWHVSEGLFYSDILQLLTDTFRLQEGKDPMGQLIRRMFRQLFLGEGVFVQTVYPQPGGKLITDPGVVAGTATIFPAESLRITPDGEVTARYTTEWHGAPNRRDPYLVLTPAGQRALMRFEASGAWVWKERGEAWEDLLPSGDEFLWRQERTKGRRGQKSLADELLEDFLRTFPMEDLTPEARLFLFGPEDLPARPPGDPTKRKTREAMARTDRPFFFDTIQVMERLLAIAEPHLTAAVPPSEDLYAQYSEGRAERDLPAHQRHPTGWAGTEQILRYLVAAWDTTYSTPALCGAAFREGLQANWPSDFMAYKAMTAHPAFFGKDLSLMIPDTEHIQARLRAIRQEFGPSLSQPDEEWEVTRATILRSWAPAIAAAATMALWSARRVCRYMRTDARAPAVIELSQIALRQHWS